MALALLAAASAAADCVDINADPAERLTAITHIDEGRAVQLIAGRPWPSVRSLTGINGIGGGRIRDILEQDLACVGVRAPRGQRERIEGVATVLDGDTFEVAGERVRLIGIDAPENNQLCQADGHDWPCGQVATAAVYEMVGGEPVSCAIYGRDRWGRGRWPSASRTGRASMRRSSGRVGRWRGTPALVRCSGRDMMRRSRRQRRSGLECGGVRSSSLGFGGGGSDAPRASCAAWRGCDRRRSVDDRRRQQIPISDRRFGHFDCLQARHLYRQYQRLHDESNRLPRATRRCASWR